MIIIMNINSIIFLIYHKLSLSFSLILFLNAYSDHSFLHTFNNTL